MNNSNVCFQEHPMYYAFKGNKIISDGFNTRLEGKDYQKVGHKCRICDAYAGGNTICHSCVCDCFNNSIK